jgi:GST-like protein
MTLTLYHGEPNGPSLVVIAALFEKRVEADRRHVDLAAGERHRLRFAHDPEVAMSIEGEGPILVADGEAMSDALFVACYLDEVGTGPALRPADAYGRWEMMMLCRRMTERVDPAAALLGCQAHLSPVLAAMSDDAFAALIEPIASEDLRARWVDLRSGAIDPAKVTDSHDKIAAAVQSTERSLDGRNYLLGEFSIADLIGFASLNGMASLLPDLFTDCPRTTAWLERLRHRPSVQRALALAKNGDPANSWAPGPEINRWG